MFVYFVAKNNELLKFMKSLTYTKEVRE